MPFEVSKEEFMIAKPLIMYLLATSSGARVNGEIYYVDEQGGPWKETTPP